MSILKRIRDITVATLNERLEESEDPIRLIDQYLSAKREQLMQSERLYQQCTAHASSLRQQYLSALETKEKREQQAALALKAGEENMARLILHEKLQAEERSDQYRGLYEQAGQSAAELEEELQAMRADYQEVLDKRGYYMARMESARLQQRLNSRTGYGDGSSSPRMFYRMEEHVSDMEMQAHVLRDLRRTTREGGSQNSNPALEKELEALRRKINREES
ncbi:PspA/IM30 family protein [Paenibacillus chitinolyticus]|uniref:PspA/IM30 family protein n=1 Tax=Paenibacillus chitinolyticus TaxID=79263 RepID=A0A410X3T8_9BACL|nr:PspA/IM30 family protein [Paenibacillus chitinolyticus]MCY9593441.1 PspA/IM30 family protein [Paenibacillus chitinolyticus]MCY9596222.1 PspA/IM30 family protein [Paenibacillus chitinolyticus]QAV21257.1 PspA/IM30 family protein [Paenibacillus chitinolyticus]